ncbi:hypothetical protein H5185_08630 [Shewanella sp. SG44-6]|jgi:hypothetical protein|uniref:hypothetical protein n=1 Tax=Shewanella sp. SG44-6 TaxID=2760959 RepID=UPI0016047985|nr:hypothetical protein [Shewanella sp. SG44-6]MBB1389486.1 hypothetical protein [Shewanella sp. SG44-6]
MKHLPNVATVALLAFTLAGCASTPSGPKSLADITPIEQSDSSALKIVKMASLDRNIKDLKVPEDFDTGGYSLTKGAVDVTAGALGVGVANAAGFSGSMSQLGLGLLMSNKNEPYKQFTFITFLQGSDTSEIYTYQKELISSLGTFVSSTKSRSGNHFSVITAKGSSFSSCKPSTTKPCQFASVLKVQAKLNGTVLNTFGLMDNHTNDSTIVQWSVPYDVLETALIKGVPIKNTYLYVPHKNHKAEKANLLGEVDKMLIKVPYLINLDTQEALFFVKK